MADVDTSAEAVERRVDELLGWLTGPDSGQNDGITETVRVLRALHARATQAETEQDALIADNAMLTQGMTDANNACAEAEADRDHLAAEVAALRLTLGGRTFDASVPEPIGCPMPGACSTVAEIVRGREMQAAWLRVIQAENTCGVTGAACDAVRCGCAAEQEMLIREAAEARAALGDGA